jgi:DNA polymerase-3 subunit alpha
VAYALGITELDPLKHDLLFERFLNPERIGMPDIDIDFCFERRGEVIEYAVQRYGQDNVCQIITFGTMAARAAIRDVGRVLAIPYSEVDRIAKLVPQDLGITLQAALDKSPDLAELAQSDPRVKELIEHARTLEGLARHASTHAAGVLITPGRLVDFVPLYKSSKGEVTTQYDMKSVEKIGLLKMDILGLRTLTVIENTLKLVAEHQDVHLKSQDIPLDDPEVFEMLSQGSTVAIFQLESTGMRDLLRRLQPTAFEDIVAVNALHRPGPLSSGMVDDFISRKHGRKTIEYLHTVLEPILEETYGVILYQEQVMRIASEMGGFSLGQADILRRAMGKKEPEAMARQRELFLEGASKRKISKSVAERIFDLMAHFAGYGFNKSHSAAYALLSLRTAYLKAHYPKEFMAATLSSEMGNSDRVLVLIEECKRMGIAVLPPDVNESEESFTVVSDGIRFGLSAVKNVGVSAAAAIVEARKKEEQFRSLRHLTTVTDLKGINRRVLESLVMAGGMESFDGHRAQLLAEVPRALEGGVRIQRDRERGQASLFGETEVVEMSESLPDVEPWSEDTAMRNEKDALGFYLSRHPLDGYREQIEACSTTSVSSLTDVGDGASVRLGGILSVVKPTLDRKGNPMAFATLEDFTGNVELLVFSDPYSKHQTLIEPDSAVLVTGRTTFRENEEPKVIVTRVLPLADAVNRMPATVHLRVTEDQLDEEFIANVGRLADRYPGKSRLLFHLVADDDGGEVQMGARSRQVAPSQELVNELHQLVGEDNAWVEQCAADEWS